ncbi:hypothetical protein Tco_1180651, partial [Tanacetum coccineum]
VLSQMPYFRLSGVRSHISVFPSYAEGSLIQITGYLHKSFSYPNSCWSSQKERQVLFAFPRDGGCSF